MKKAVIIFNSTKRKSSFIQNLDELIKGLCEREFKVEVRATLSSTDIEDYIHTLIDVDLLVGAGGDGTINQIVNAISKNELIDPHVLFFPTGTVNDFATSLKLKNDIKYGLKLVDENKFRRVDSACINKESYFNYVCAFGPFTSASYTVSTNLKNELGALAYVLKGLSDVVTKTKAYHINANVDDREIEGEFNFGMIVNSHSVAGLKTFFRASDITDGEYTLFLLKSTPQNIAILPKVIINGIGEEYIEPGVVCISFKHADIKVDQEVVWTIDGEKGPNGNIEVEVKPQNIKMYTEL